MERNDDEATEGWELEALEGLVVRARREVEGGSQEVEAHLQVDEEAETLMLGLGEGSVRSSGVLAEEPAPFGMILRWANRPANVLALLDGRHPARKLTDLGPEVRARGKKSDVFYAMVLLAQRVCENQGIPFARRVADDNGVSTEVVYRWRSEAKRRRITIDDEGHAWIDDRQLDTEGDR